MKKLKMLGRYNCFCHGCGKEISCSEYRKNVRLYDMGCCNRCIENLRVEDRMELRMLVKDRRKRKVLEKIMGQQLNESMGGKVKKKMNKKKVIWAVGIVGVIVVGGYMAMVALPLMEEMRFEGVKYPLPKSNVDCSNCVLVKTGGTICPCSASSVPYHSANGMDWENNSMYIVHVDGGHEFWIEESAMKKLEDGGEKMSHLSCKQPNDGSRRLSYLFVFENGGIRRTISESYVVKDTWIEGRGVEEG